jgi:hypothetical protein
VAQAQPARHKPQISYSFLKLAQFGRCRGTVPTVAAIRIICVATQQAGAQNMARSAAEQALAGRRVFGKGLKARRSMIACSPSPSMP